MLKNYDAVDYLVKKYVTDDNVATIPIKLSKKEDFFNQFDPTHTSVSPDISDYIDRCSYHLPVKYKIKLKVSCPGLSDDDKDKMKNAVKNHYGLIAYDEELDLRSNWIKTLLLLTIGIVFLIFVYFNLDLNITNKMLDTTVDIFREVLLVTGWVFVWSAIDRLVFKSYSLHDDKRNNIQMLNAEMIFDEE